MLNSLLPLAKGRETILDHGTDGSSAGVAGDNEGESPLGPRLDGDWSWHREPGRENPMRFPTLLAYLLMTITATADDELTVLRDGPGGGSPRTMLSKFLNGEAGKAFDARRAAVAALKTPDDLAGRQREIRGKFVEALGGFPEKTPLKARVVGTDVRDGYRVEKVIYESRPDHHVTAIFYLPGGQGAVPRRADALRPQRQRQGRGAVPARLHPAGEERPRGALLRPHRPGRAAAAARPRRQAGHPGQHDRAHDGRRRRPARRPEHRELPHLGRHPQPRLPREPAGDRPEAARLHRLLRRRHADVVPDGPGRPHRRGGAVVLHHVAGAAVRHHRPAGRRAEHHRPGRLRHGARRLHRPCARRGRR